MRASTIFRAYQRAESGKRNAEQCRMYYDFKSSLGIGVGKDQYALVWQKYNRQAHAFEERLFKILQ